MVDTRPKFNLIHQADVAIVQSYHTLLYVKNICFPRFPSFFLPFAGNCLQCFT